MAVIGAPLCRNDDLTRLPSGETGRKFVGAAMADGRVRYRLATPLGSDRSFP